MPLFSQLFFAGTGQVNGQVNGEWYRSPALIVGRQIILANESNHRLRNERIAEFSNLSISFLLGPHGPDGLVYDSLFFLSSLQFCLRYSLKDLGQHIDRYFHSISDKSSFDTLFPVPQRERRVQFIRSEIERVSKKISTLKDIPEDEDLTLVLKNFSSDFEERGEIFLEDPRQALLALDFYASLPDEKIFQSRDQIRKYLDILKKQQKSHIIEKKLDKIIGKETGTKVPSLFEKKIFDSLARMFKDGAIFRAPEKSINVRYPRETLKNYTMREFYDLLSAIYLLGDYEGVEKLLASMEQMEFKKISQTSYDKEACSIEYLRFCAIFEQKDYARLILDLGNFLRRNLKEDAIHFEYLLGEAYFKKNDFDKAEICYLNVAAKDPHYRSVLDRLNVIKINTSEKNK